MGKFKKVFRGLPDPRADNAQHELADILFIALAALLCGAETSSDMAEFGLAKEEFFRQILVLKHGIPSHDTFSRVFRLLDAQPDWEEPADAIELPRVVVAAVSAALSKASGTDATTLCFDATVPTPHGPIRVCRDGGSLEKSADPRRVRAASRDEMLFHRAKTARACR